MFAQLVLILNLYDVHIHVEQLTYMLFLKMFDQHTKLLYNQLSSYHPHHHFPLSFAAPFL